MEKLKVKPQRIYIVRGFDYQGDVCENCGFIAEVHYWVDMLPYPYHTIVNCSLKDDNGQS